MRIVFLLPIVGSLLATLIVIITTAASLSAPQEAAGYCLACACAVIPYVLARSVAMMSAEKPSDCTNRIIAALTSKPLER
jgi:hypothetical protein